MPTADEFARFAAWLDEIAVEVVAELGRVERASVGAVVGGTVADRMARMSDEVAAATARVQAGLLEAAAEARRRAAACREYRAAMAVYRAEVARWEAASAALPWLPTDARSVPPPHPGPWAEEG